MIYAISTALVMLLATYLTSEAHETYFHSYMPHGGVFFIFLLLAIYFVGKSYCIEWEKAGNRVGMFLYEKLIFPFTLILFLLGKLPVDYVSKNGLLLGSVLLLFLLLGDWGERIKGIILKIYPGMSGIEAKNLFLHYPTRSRLDMLPFDLLFNGLFFFMVYKRAFY